MRQLLTRYQRQFAITRVQERALIEKLLLVDDYEYEKTVISNNLLRRLSFGLI